MSNLVSGARARYHAEGYYVASECVDARGIDAFLGDVGLVLATQLAHCQLPSPGPSDDLDTIYRQLQVLHEHDQATYVATLRVFNKFKSLYDLFLSDSIAQACRELGVALPLMHTLPLFHIVSHRLRIEGGYHGFDAHQDWHGLQTSLNAIIVWLPLHDIDRTRLPMEVWPRSHRYGIREGRLDGPDSEFIPLEVGKGDVVFLSPFTIHRTGVTDTDALRIAASWRYEDALEPTFVDRKYPFAQGRSISGELFFPGFPDRAQMQKLLG